MRVTEQSAVRGVIEGYRHLLRLDAPRRAIETREDDIFLTSYPRSGNTWLRFIVANLLYPNREVGFREVQEAVPDIYKVSRRRLASTGSPRVLKSHEYFDPRYRKVVYLVRDPRDVAVSYFHYQKKTGIMAKAIPIERFVQDFVEGRADGLGTWGQHVNSWLSTREPGPDFLVLRYEDLIQDARRGAKEVASFLSLPAGDEAIERAVIASSLPEMKRSELEVLSSKERADLITHVRKGRTGAWQEELSRDLGEMIRHAFSDQMRTMGYQNEPS